MYPTFSLSLSPSPVSLSTSITFEIGKPWPSSMFRLSQIPMALLPFSSSSPFFFTRTVKKVYGVVVVDAAALALGVTSLDLQFLILVKPVFSASLGLPHYKSVIFSQRLGL
ncbi:hypothetical protein CDL15_Pgr019009 [Punica granatum]|uniref:Uncharacterized protein n=1 Tax=Punica granatum TaxID=22663 RepID=A0A218XJL1_PUNGR|nr:hypothetical protein CDL15_Pgr019009 [Punica granatum]PKI74091.1 hypothetical protein CRG98_005569 [Punica granatum]